jgi:hypothetical protein
MKALPLLYLILAGSLSLSAAPSELERFSPHLSSKTQIIWNASTNQLPTSFWVYRRQGPRIFSASVISNAMALGSVQSRGIPKPSTNDFFIWEDHPPNYPGPIFSVFSIRPRWANIGYSMPHSDRGTGTDIPNDAIVIGRAWRELPRFGIDPKQVKLKNLTSWHCIHDEMGRDVTNRLCGRGVFLSRQLDGISFYGTGDEGDDEGFWIQLGSHERVRAFALVWPSLDRYKLQRIASPEQIIECFRRQRVLVVPENDEGTPYFPRIARLATVHRIIVTKITPYYGEFALGEAPNGKDDVPPEFVTPFAELEVMADFGTNKETAIVLSPILSSEVVRLLNKDKK